MRKEATVGSAALFYISSDNIAPRHRAVNFISLIIKSNIDVCLLSTFSKVTTETRFSVNDRNEKNFNKIRF